MSILDRLLHRSLLVCLGATLVLATGCPDDDPPDGEGPDAGQINGDAGDNDTGTNDLPGPEPNPELYPAEEGDQWGYIDTDGEFEIEAQYDHATAFSEGWARVEDDGEYHFIDADNDIRLSPGVDWVDNFHEDLAAARDGDDTYGFIDRNGEFVVEPQFRQAGFFSEGLAAVDIEDPDSDQSSWAYIADSGEVVIDGPFDGARHFNDQLAPVIEEDGFVTGHWGYIDRDGNLEIDYQFDDAHSFSEGLAVVEIEPETPFDTGYGYIDETGEVVIDTDYEHALAFTEGVAPATTESTGDFYYIDADGDQVFPDNGGFDFALPFDGPLARVALSGGTPSQGHGGGERQWGLEDIDDWAYIDQNGNQVWPDED